MMDLAEALNWESAVSKLQYWGKTSILDFAEGQNWKSVVSKPQYWSKTPILDLTEVENWEFSIFNQKPPKSQIEKFQFSIWASPNSGIENFQFQTLNFNIGATYWKFSIFQYFSILPRPRFGFTNENNE